MLKSQHKNKYFDLSILIVVFSPNEMLKNNLTAKPVKTFRAPSGIVFGGLYHMIDSIAFRK